MQQRIPVKGNHRHKTLRQESPVSVTVFPSLADPTFPNISLNIISWRISFVFLDQARCPSTVVL